MSSSCRTERDVVKRCRNCKGLFPARDNFCRWCGAHQTEDTAPISASCCQHKTKVMREDEGIPQPLLSQSLNTLARSVAAKNRRLRLNQPGVVLIAVLIAIPMWLLIILLSPFDAYTSARDASSQLSIQ